MVAAWRWQDHSVIVTYLLLGVLVVLKAPERVCMPLAEAACLDLPLKVEAARAFSRRQRVRVVGRELHPYAFDSRNWVVLVAGLGVQPLGHLSPEDWYGDGPWGK